MKDKIQEFMQQIEQIKIKKTRWGILLFSLFGFLSCILVILKSNETNKKTVGIFSSIAGLFFAVLRDVYKENN